MILHTVVEHSKLITFSYDFDVQYKQVKGCICQYNKMGTDCKLERIISTDLRDYLNPRFSPGTLI